MKQYISSVKLPKLLSSVLVAMTLLCAGCEGCKPAALERDRYKGDLMIKMPELNNLLQINSTNPVLEITGEITQNNIEETVQTYAVVIPLTGGDVEKAIRSFMQSKNQPPASTSIVSTSQVLPDSLGGVYSYMEIQALQQGEVQANICVTDLIPGKYKVHLMAYHKDFGAFYSPESKEIEIFAANINPPSIAMEGAEPSREMDGTKAFIALTMAAKTNHATPEMTGGFLFIEEAQGNGAALTPENLIASGGPIPVVNQFTKAFGDKAIVCSFPAVGDEIKMEKIKDEQSIFKPGASYQVYAYLIDQQFHDSTNLIISPTSKRLVIPKNVVEMTMQEAKIIAMRKCQNDDSVPTILKRVQQLAIHYQMKINKHESIAAQLNLGYLVLKNPLDQQAGIAKVRQLLSTGAQIFGKVTVYESGQECLYLDDPAKLHVNQTGEFVSDLTIPSVPLELEKTYHIYACVVLDGRDVFMSENAVEIEVPNVDLTINKFETKKFGGEFRTISAGKIKVNVDFQDPEQADVRTTGYILYPDQRITKQPTEVPGDLPLGLKNAMEDLTLLGNLSGILEEIVGYAFQNAEDIKKGEIKKPDEIKVIPVKKACVAFIEDRSGDHTQVATAPYGDAFEGVGDDVKFQVAKVWCHGNVIFFKQAENASQVFTWYRIDNPEKPFLPITQADGTRTKYLYRYDTQSWTYAELVLEQGRTRTRVTHSAANHEDIVQLLRNVFKGADAEEDIKEFIRVMQITPY